MAAGDLAFALQSNGNTVAISIDGADSADLTYSAGDEIVGVTYDLTRQSYSGTTLGTTNLSGQKLYYLSSSGSSPAVITAKAETGIFDNDTSIVFDATAGAIVADTVSSNAIADASPAGTSSRDYADAACRIVGVIDSSGNLLVDHATVSGEITVEVYATHPSGIAAVTIALSDGTNSKTVTVTDETLSDYEPTRYYGGLREHSYTDVDLYATKFDKGSGFYRATFDLSSDGAPSTFTDGGLTLTATAYPVEGDADSLTQNAWTLRNDHGDSDTETVYYVDSRATIAVTGGSGTFKVGERITGGTSGAFGCFVKRVGDTLHFCATSSANDFGASETITGYVSGATTTTDGSPSYNGSDSYDGDAEAYSSGTTGPYRTLPKAIEQMSSAAASARVITKCAGDSDIAYYTAGKEASNNTAPFTWQTVTHYNSSSRGQVVVYARSPSDGVIESQMRANMIRFYDLTLYLCLDVHNEASSFEGRPSSNPDIWFDGCNMTHPDGHTTYGSASGATLNYVDVFYTNCKSYEHNTRGIYKPALARDVWVEDVEEDLTRQGLVYAEVFCKDGPTHYNPSGHGDIIQNDADAPITDRNVVYYNFVGDFKGGQLFLVSDNDLLSISNTVLSSTDAGVGDSQIGEISTAHRLRDIFITHTTLAYGSVRHRDSGGADVDENCYFMYSVAESFTYDERNGTQGCHLLDPAGTIYGDQTAQSSGNPWVDGPDYDEANSVGVDFRPEIGSDIDGTLTATPIHKYDAYGFERTSGAFAPGAIETRRAAVFSSVSGTDGEQEFVINFSAAVSYTLGNGPSVRLYRSAENDRQSASLFGSPIVIPASASGITSLTCTLSTGTLDADLFYWVDLDTSGSDMDRDSDSAPVASFTDEPMTVTGGGPAVAVGSRDRGRASVRERARGGTYR
jgi:hypothetical protein